MNYFSLTSPSIRRDFASALREGLAPDRVALHVPGRIPQLKWSSFAGFVPLVNTRMLLPYVGGSHNGVPPFDLMEDALDFEITWFRCMKT